MKREFLEELGLEKVVIDKIMDENGKDLEVEQNKTAAVKGQLDIANQSINNLKADLEKFEGADIDGLKTKISEWETKYNTDIEAERTKAENVKKEFTLKEALKKAGVKDPDYLLFKQGGIEKFAFNDKGEAIGLEDMLKPARESNPDWFVSDENSAGGNGDGNGNSGGGKVSISFGASSEGGSNNSSTSNFMNDAIRGAFSG